MSLGFKEISMAKLFSTDGKSALSMLTGSIGTILLVIAAFVIGSLYTENRYLKAGSTAPVNQQAAAQPAAGQPAAPQVSLDTIKGLFGGKYVSFGDASRKVLFVE